MDKHLDIRTSQIDLPDLLPARDTLRLIGTEMVQDVLVVKVLEGPNEVIDWDAVDRLFRKAKHV